MGKDRFCYELLTQEKLCFRTSIIIFGIEPFKVKILYEVLSKRDSISLKGGVKVVCVI